MVFTDLKNQEKSRKDIKVFGILNFFTIYLNVLILNLLKCSYFYSKECL